MATDKFSRNVSSPTICILVGRKIREFRLEKGWSVQMLADHAGVEKAHLTRLENGHKEAGLLILQKIADALGVPVWELLKA